MTDFTTIDQLEDRLAAAQVAHDVDTLDELLHDDLSYTDPAGASGTKQDDLQAHRDGAYTLTRFDVASREYEQIAPTVVIARVRMVVESDLGNGTMSYTRAWVDGDKGWQVRNAHLHMH